MAKTLVGTGRGSLPGIHQSHVMNLHRCSYHSRKNVLGSTDARKPEDRGEHDGMDGGSKFEVDADDAGSAAPYISVER